MTSRFGVLLLLALVTGAAWIAFAQEEDPRAAQVAGVKALPGVADQPASPGAERQHARGARKGTSRPELPPVGVPLAHSLDALRARADLGDPVANCRLALETSLCMNRPTHTPDLEGLAAIHPEMESGVVSTLTAIGADAAALAIHCEGVGPLEINARERLRAAAESGDVRVRVTYALFQSGQLVRLHVPPGIHDSGAPVPVTQHYADHAVRYLEEGLQQHDVLALEGLIILHAPASLQRPVALPLKQPDPHRFLLLLGVYQALFPGIGLPHDLQQISAALFLDMSAEERDRVESETATAATSWHARARLEQPAAGRPSPSDVDRFCDSQAAT